MARQLRPPIQGKDLRGLKYFKVLGPLLDGLHRAGTTRDKAGNRVLHLDQYAALLLYFFNPIVKCLRGILLRSPRRPAAAPYQGTATTTSRSRIPGKATIG